MPILINYERVPVPHMIGELRWYIEHGIPPGGFLTAVASNNLSEAVRRADEANQTAIVAWVKWFCSHAPNGCWGSPAKVEAWIQAGGRNGSSTDAA